MLRALREQNRIISDTKVGDQVLQIIEQTSNKVKHHLENGSEYDDFLKTKQKALAVYHKLITDAHKQVKEAVNQFRLVLPNLAHKQVREADDNIKKAQTYSRIVKEGNFQYTFNHKRSVNV